MNSFRYILVFSTLKLLILPLVAKCVVLNPDCSLQPQLRQEGITYQVSSTIDLKGSTLAFPSNCVVEFSKRGIITNGTIILDETELKGKIRLDCLIKGTIKNEELKISSFNTSDPRALTRQLASVFNLKKPCHIVVDKDIELDGGISEVAYISLSGKKVIRNSCSFKIKGDIKLNDVSFKDFKNYVEVFLDYSKLERVSSIEINNVRFDGSNKIDRFLYCPYIRNHPTIIIQVEQSQFSHINNYVVCFRSNCTGTIKDNLVSEIGTSRLSNVCGFHLGASDLDYNACKFVIEGNYFHDFLVPYSNVHDSREAHAILLYGHNSVVKNNRVSDFHTEIGHGSDTGMDSEGIYIKGGDNLVEYNVLENCIGSSPDGAITFKSTFPGNVIRNNTIIHNYGIGIQCYTPESRIEHNLIKSSGEAEACIALLSNRNTVITGNTLILEDDSKVFHAAVELTRSRDIEIYYNSFEKSGSVLCTYDCTGTILFKDNEISLIGKVFGANTYYTAPFALHNDSAIYRINDNQINVKRTRASQLIEASSSFLGTVSFEGNTILFDKTKEDNSIFSYLFRNVDVLKVGKNQLNKKEAIGKVSSKHGINLQELMHN